MIWITAWLDFWEAWLARRPTPPPGGAEIVDLATWRKDHAA